MAHRPPEQITPGMKGPMALKNSKQLFEEMQAKLHPGIPKFQMYNLHETNVFNNAPPTKKPRRLTGKIPRGK